MQVAANPIPDVRKIAVLRANGIGDLVFALPALEALRKAFPQAEIILLGQAWHAEFFRGRPGPVDRVLVVPHMRGIDAPGGAEPTVEDDTQAQAEFFQAAARESFDLAFQLHGGGRYSNPFVRKLGARLTFGLKTPDADPLDRWVPYVYFQPEILRYLEVVALAGAPPADLEPRIAVTKADLEEAGRVVPGDEPIAVLHPGAGDARRRWRPENFARVGDELAARGFRVAVTGTPPESDLVERVGAAMQHPAINLCGKISLGGLVGLLAQASIVIANDSGTLHLAEAVGAPTVGIYWCANLITTGPITRTRHRPLLSWRLACPVCGHDIIYDPCEHRVSFVDDIPVEDVTAMAWDLLGLLDRVPPDDPSHGR
jgi:ADP-heptose:LPS heptosyltransferase